MKQTSKSSFAPDWLALREPADHAARDPDLLAAAAECVQPGDTVLDLGSGTGSTARAFAQAGFAGWNWRLCDQDPVLLDIARGNLPDAETALTDLADLDALPLEGVGLVTCSALLDLMPLEWITLLADRLSRRNIPFYAALSYDGVMRWDPPDVLDNSIALAFNQHQQTDKGLGPAMGPRAAEAALIAFAAKGYDTRPASSPWQIGADQASLHEMLVEGIGDAAHEAGIADAVNWTKRRIAAAYDSQATIGHIDLLALPPGFPIRRGSDHAGH